VDAPVGFGSQQELVATYWLDNMIPERFERADQTGSSVTNSDRFTWPDAYWMVRECDLSEPRWLKRENLRAFCEAITDVDKLMALTDPLGDD
jgi:hypothetical protein